MKRLIKSFIIVVSCLQCGCEPEVSRDYPVVITMSVKDINNEGATLVGTLGPANLEGVINCGFVWSRSQLNMDTSFPNESLSTTIDLGKPGGRTFNARIDSYLGAGIDYMVRAFVQTTSQKVYGASVTFHSLGSSKSATLRDFTPKVAKPNDTIIITGNYFGTTTFDKYIQFGEERVTQPFFVSDTILKVAVPTWIKPQDCILSIYTSQGTLQTTDQLSVMVPYWNQLQPFPGNPQYFPISFTIDSYGYMGLSGGGTDFWQYNPANDAWSQMTDFPGLPRYRATYFAVGAKGYVGLGYSSDGAAYNDFWEFDPASDSWKQLNDFPVDHAAFGIQFAISSKGYAGALYGGSFWEYDPATDNWIGRADVPVPPDSFWTGSFSYNSKGYILSSEGLYFYDPAGNEWSHMPAAPNYSLSFFASPVLAFPSGVTYFFGYNGVNLRVDVNSNSWILTAPPPNLQEPYGAFGFVLGTKGFIGKSIVYELDPSKE